MVDWSKTYIVVAGDLHKSKKASQRHLIQENLKKGLGLINSEFTKSVVADFKVVGGDGFQGMLKDAIFVLEVYYRLFEFIDHPFYFSVGIGGIATKVSKRIDEVDGRAFHLAIEGLDEAKRRGLWVAIKADVEDIDLISCLWNLLAERMWEWTDRQKQIILYYRRVRTEPDAIARTAKRFGVSQRNIYKLLQASKYWLTEYAEGMVKQYMNRI